VLVRLIVSNVRVLAQNCEPIEKSIRRDIIQAIPDRKVKLVQAAMQFLRGSILRLAQSARESSKPLAYSHEITHPHSP
jgi:hypothetical protein